MSNLSSLARRCAMPIAAVAAALSLSSCGGGDPYTGLWEGTQNGNQPVKVMLLSDGTYYMKYGATALYPGIPIPPLGAPITPGGLVRGTGEFHGANFKSDDGFDSKFAYPLQGPGGARITGKVGGHQTVTGNVNGIPLTLKYIKPFEPHGVLADLAGSYPGQVTFSLGLRETVFEVKADGSLTTSLNGCSITGRVVPRPDDAFDLTINFGAFPCVFPGAVFRGAAMYSHDLKQLEAAVLGPYAQAITFVARKSN